MPHNLKTIREQILIELTERLANIQKVNGFITDAGKVLYYGRMQAISPNELPAINFWDSEEVLAKEFGINSRKFTVTIEVYDKKIDLNLPEIGNRLKADIDVAISRRAALWQEMNVNWQNIDQFWNEEWFCPDETFGDLVQYFDFIRSDIFLLENSTNIGGIILEYQFVYQQAHGNPFYTN